MAKPTDPLYADQWHFDLLGDIEKVWNDYDGSGVTVAVYDEGVQYTHEDLDGNYDASMHFTYDGITYDAMPIDANSGHGTSCAGLIGAEANNGVGGTGVAPGVTLTGVNYLDDIQFQSAEIYDAAMLWAGNFDIMSNSWGYSQNFSRVQNISDPNSGESHDLDLWTQIVAEGRDGLGTIILKAAGNETTNSNGDGLNASRMTITVSATDLNGDATNYTNYGSSILVAGPASAVTTDLSGNAGYNNNRDDDLVPVDYTSTFNGTSAATPTVAGIVALMLDANPDLGWRDVQNILALSASHTGSDLGGPGESDEVGSWQLVGGNTWNGGGTMFHQSYGYGMANAYGAVRLAEAWEVIYPNALTTANERSARGTYNGSAFAIPDNNGVAGTGQVSLDMNVTKDIAIENIEVTITMTHANSRNMNIWLQAPDGTRIQMLNEGDTSGRTMDDGLTWVYGVDSLRGYSSAGTWSVVFEDTVTGDTGTVQDASIEFFGSSASIDTVFTFTDDFSAAAAVETSRKTIDDIDGGVDWLNFAAMTGDINLTMKAGGAIAVDGAVIAHLDSSLMDMENAFMGDGFDTINGNGFGNEIHTMRGNDLVYSYNGNDSVYGDLGRDTLYGENGNDKLYGGDNADWIYGSTGSDQLFGAQGSDSFVFSTSGGTDRIHDFEDNTDTLKIESDIWGGGLSREEFVAEYALVVNGNTVFNFGGGNKITVMGVTDTSIFVDDIAFI